MSGMPSTCPLRAGTKSTVGWGWRLLASVLTSISTKRMGAGEHHKQFPKPHFASAVLPIPYIVHTANLKQHKEINLTYLFWQEDISWPDLPSQTLLAY